jgi:hypothetical protein
LRGDIGKAAPPRDMGNSDDPAQILAGVVQDAAQARIIGWIATVDEGRQGRECPGEGLLLRRHRAGFEQRGGAAPVVLPDGAENASPARVRTVRKTVKGLLRRSVFAVFIQDQRCVCQDLAVCNAKANDVFRQGRGFVRKARHLPSDHRGSDDANGVHRRRNFARARVIPPGLEAFRSFG